MAEGHRVTGLLEAVMSGRADRLVDLLMPHLPAGGALLDIGSGTGHTVQALRRRTGLELFEADVVDMHVVGAGPVLFDGRRLPFTDGRFDATLLLYVLQYCTAPLELLREAARVTRGPVLVLQSTWRDAAGFAALRANELLWGPAAFTLARLTGWVGPCSYSLEPRTLFSWPGLHGLFRQAGLRVRAQVPATRRTWPVRRTLYILEPDHADAAR